MSFSIETRHYSHDLIVKRGKLTLAVPGPQLASLALGCGLHSGRDLYKQKAFGVALETPPHDWAAPFLSEANANIAVQIVDRIDAGDHSLFLAEVVSYFVAEEDKGPPLLSVGMSHSGYTVLAQSGIHRIGVVNHDYRS